MHPDESNIVASVTPGLGSRIAKIANLVGGKKHLARAIGISESQLYRYISGDSQPTVEPLAAIAKCGSVHLDWLVLGQGPTGSTQQVNEDHPGYNGKSIYVEIEEYRNDSIEPVNQSANDLGTFAFNKLWLIKSGLIPENLRLIRAHGDAMAPTISNGAMLIIDISQTKFCGDAIYLLNVDAKLLVAKRIQHSADNGLVIVSDNAAYRDQHIANEHKDNLAIVGKVVWAGGLV